MSEKSLVWIAALASVASLVVSYKMAVALQKAKADIDKTAEKVSEGPLGAIAKIAGISF